jgi:hypothetical protein
MTYVELYARCQSLPVAISRKTVRDMVRELTGRQGGRQVWSGRLDPAICRGLYLSSRNPDSILVRQFNGDVVVVSRGLDPLLDRFIYVKELMHMFDDPEEAVDSGDKFEDLLNEFGEAPSPGRSVPMLSEYGCFWMALGALCPEECRLDLAEKRGNGLDDHQISEKLKLPVQYVPRLFESRYPDLMKCLSKGQALEY